jgi:predicted nuclease of restriction endonuclease-like (RecB) superfamily
VTTKRARPPGRVKVTVPPKKGGASRLAVGTSRALAPAGYEQLLIQLKSRIRAAQLKAARAVNAELVVLYWSIGRDILDRQKKEGWGANVIDRLSTDLRKSFPEMQGFSSRNLRYMRAFAAAWPDESILQAPLAELTWYHNVTLLERLETPEQRLWYAHRAIEHGWSRSVLVVQIETGLRKRTGKALTNFRATLPPPHSDLAHETLKDPYVFDFLTLGPDAQERDLEQGLIDHVQRFLMELGVGFAFVGRQVHIEVADEDFYVDLLLYHLKLRCFVVIELKAVAFRPEFAGKMNFYLSAVDAQMRHPDDQPSIGLLLCKAKNGLVVEYALRDVRKPIGVAQWETRIVESLPKELKGNLPTIEELEAELAPKRRKRP